MNCLERNCKKNQGLLDSPLMYIVHATTAALLKFKSLGISGQKPLKYI